MDQSTLTQLVLQTLREFGLPPEVDLNSLTPDTLLFGPNGLLDSIALVSFVLDVEMAIQDASGLAVTLADERAMSQKRSPFRQVSSLAEYASILIQESKTGA
jgi:hypothetical protein